MSHEELGTPKEIRQKEKLGAKKIGSQKIWEQEKKWEQKQIGSKNKIGRKKNWDAAFAPRMSHWQIPNATLGRMAQNLASSLTLMFKIENLKCLKLK
jgi:hypothetical protein